MPSLMDFEILLNTLKLSRYLMAPDLRAFALHAIDNRKWHINPVELMHICIEFKTKNYFVHAFERLITRRIRHFSDADIQKMTWPVYVAITRFIDILDEHRRIVACEPPQVLHSLDCHNPVACAQDWMAIWWNGMGRFLLDGRCQLTYDNAFKRFQLLQFGEVSNSCKLAMFQFISEGEGFMRGYMYTKHYAANMADILVSIDGLERADN
jgi:hypothetical protein